MYSEPESSYTPVDFIDPPDLKFKLFIPNAQVEAIAGIGAYKNVSATP